MCDGYVTVHVNDQSVLTASEIEGNSSPWTLLSCDYSTQVLVVAICHIINWFKSSPVIFHRMGYASLQLQIIDRALQSLDWKMLEVSVLLHHGNCTMNLISLPLLTVLSTPISTNNMF